MIEKADRKSEESNVSRILQQKVPVTNERTENEDISFTIKSRNEDADTPTHLTEHDTIDKAIYDNRFEKKYVNYSEILIDPDADDSLKLKAVKNFFKTTEFTEADIGSEKGEYNKIKVDIDREGHKFFFDWTPGNNRTFLSHPSNTYWFIDNEGNYTIKSTGDFNELSSQSKNTIVANDNNCLVNADYNIEVLNNFRVQSKGLVLSGGSTVLYSDGESSFFTGKQRKTKIGGDDLINIDGSKFEIVNGVYYIKSNDPAGIILEAKRIEFRSPTVFNSKTSASAEDVKGKKRITAGNVEISGTNGLSIGAPMGHMQTQALTLEEEITGPFPGLNLFTSKTVAKKTNAEFGDIETKTLLGNILLESVLFGAKLEATIGGDIILTTKMGKVKVGGLTGITEIDGKSLIKLGTGAEPVVLGLKKQQWDATHTHFSPFGPTGFPIEAADLLNTLSTKVFTE